MTTIVSLIGQQPIPNLLPIRHLDEVETAIMIYSSFTKQTSDQLVKLIQSDLKEVSSFQVEAYTITDLEKTIREELNKRGLESSDLIFNITGGTKFMSLAAYLVASKMKARFIYLESQGSKSLLHHYEFKNGEPSLIKSEELPSLISVDDYLRAYVGSYEVTGFAKSEPGHSFERAIYDVLKPVVDEILPGAKLLGALDVDFVVRCDNQVGIIEAKTGKGSKKGLDQLNTAGGQQYLGTYTKKFLVSDHQWDHTLSNLKELADARRIKVIELSSYLLNSCISVEDATKLRLTVCTALGRALPTSS